MRLTIQVQCVEKNVSPKIVFIDVILATSETSWKINVIVIVPTHYSGGGTIYVNGFFVQSISADRYINRTEL